MLKIRTKKLYYSYIYKAKYYYILVVFYILVSTELFLKMYSVIVGLIMLQYFYHLVFFSHKINQKAAIQYDLVIGCWTGYSPSLALLACVRYKNCIILVEEEQQQLARKYLYWQLLCTKFRPIKSTFVITLKVVIFSQMFIKLWNNYRDSSMIFTEVPCIKCSIYTITST